MKRLIAAVSFAVLAAPALAQSGSVGRTSPIGPDSVFALPTASAMQLASSGATRSDAEIAVDANAIASDAAELTRHVENRPGYFDPSN
jgi:uncharacterized protein YdeI (BOF family)